MSEKARGASVEQMLIVTLFVVIPVFVFPFIADDTRYPRFLFWTIALLAFVLANKKIFLIENIKSFWLKPIVILLSLLNLWILVVSLYANNKSESLGDFLKFFLVLITAFFLHPLFKNKTNFTEIILKCICLLSLLCNVVMLYQFFVFQVDLSSYKSIIEITSLNGNKNLYTEFVCMCLPFCVLSFTQFKSWWRAISLVAILITLFVAIFLQSRAVWLTFFFLLLVYSYYLAVFSGKKLKLTGVIKFVVSATLMVVFVFVFSNDKLKKSLGSRASSIVNIKENGSAQGRLVLWSKTMALVKQHPIVGVGGGNWKIEFQQYGQKDFTTVFNVRPMNDYVLALAEWGVPGFILYVVILGYLVVLLFKQLKTETNEYLRRLHFSVLCAVISFSVISFFSYTNERAENLILLSLFMAYSAANSSARIKDNSTSGFNGAKVVKGVLIGLLAFGCIFFFYKIKGEYFNTKIQTARKYQNHKDVIAYATKAESVFYKMDESSTPVSWYSGVSKFILKNPTAIDDFIKAHKINPYHIHVLNNLATAYEHVGDSKKAIELYNRAIDISPKFNDAIFNLTVAYINVGSYRDADLTIKKWNGKKTENYYAVSKFIKEKLKALPTQNGN